MIQVGFSTTHMYLSRIIRFFTKSECSHAFFVFDLFGKAWVLEAGFFGVTLLALEKFQKTNTVIALVPIEATESDLEAAMEELGDRYDFGGLLGSFFVIVGRWFKKKWKNPWDAPKALFCSEFVVKALQANGYPGAENLVAADTTPQDLLDFLTEA